MGLEIKRKESFIFRAFNTTDAKLEYVRWRKHRDPYTMVTSQPYDTKLVSTLLQRRFDEQKNNITTMAVVYDNNLVYIIPSTLPS